MDRFQEMQVFVRIAERRSFSLAAQDLQIPRATVTNLIKRLEQRIGVRLLERTTRRVRVTVDGDQYYRRCIRLLADVEEADNAFRETKPKGFLRVNLQGTLARHFVMPALGTFMDQYPDIDLHIGEDDRFIDLLQEGVDCVLRAGILPDSTMTGRQVASMVQVTVASPAYIRRYGEPRSLEELHHHVAVDYVSDSHVRQTSLDFLTADGIIQRTLSSKVSVTGAELYTGAALSGLGIVQVPKYRIEQALNMGHLIVLLADFPPPPMPVSVLYTHHRQRSARVRVFTEWLASCFVTESQWCA